MLFVAVCFEGMCGYTYFGVEAEPQGLSARYPMFQGRREASRECGRAEGSGSGDNAEGRRQEPQRELGRRQKGSPGGQSQQMTDFMGGPQRLEGDC